MFVGLELEGGFDVDGDVGGRMLMLILLTMLCLHCFFVVVWRWVLSSEWIIQS